MNRRLVVLAVSAAALALGGLAWPGVARADQCDWEGYPGSAWSEPENWSCGHAPGAADSVTVGGEVELDAGASVGSLTVKSGASIRDTSQSHTLNVLGSLTWTGGEILVEVKVTGKTVVEGDEDKWISGPGLLTTASSRDGLEISGPGVLWLSTDPGSPGISSPLALLKQGARIRGSVCCSTVSTWRVDDLRVAGDAHVIDVGLELGIASVASGATLSLSGGRLQVEQSTGGRAFGTATGYTGGRIVVGAPQPDRDGSEPTEAHLPSELILGSIAWEHRGGTMYARGTSVNVTGPATGPAGNFAWTGGSLAGTMTFTSSRPVPLDMAANNGMSDTLFLVDEGSARVGKLDVGNTSTLRSGSTLWLSDKSVLTVSQSGQFTQQGATIVSASSCCSQTARVVNHGTWTLDAEESVATIRDLPIAGDGTWNVGAGTLEIAGERAATLKKVTVQLGDVRSGLVRAENASLSITKLAVTMAPGFSPRLGEEFAVATGRSMSVQERTVEGGNINARLFLDLATTSTVATLKASTPVEITVSCQPCRRTNATGNVSFTFTVMLSRLATQPLRNLEFRLSTFDIQETSSDECGPRRNSSTCRITQLTPGAIVRITGQALLDRNSSSGTVGLTLKDTYGFTGTTGAVVRVDRQPSLSAAPTACRSVPCQISTTQAKSKWVQWRILTNLPTLAVVTLRLPPEAAAARHPECSTTAGITTCRPKFGVRSPTGFIDTGLALELTFSRTGTYVIDGKVTSGSLEVPLGAYRVTVNR